MTDDEIVEIGARAMHDGTSDDRGPWEAREYAAKRAYLNAMRRALDALREAGLAVVPAEPTEAMAKAGCYCGVPLCSSEEVARAAYRAMIAAALPTPPATGGET